MYYYAQNQKGFFCHFTDEKGFARLMSNTKFILEKCGRFMGKKFVAFTLLLLCLCAICCPAAAAGDRYYYLHEAKMYFNIADGDIPVFTTDMEKDDPVLEEYGYTYNEMQEELESFKAYLWAWMENANQFATLFVQTSPAKYAGVPISGYDFQKYANGSADGNGIDADVCAAATLFEGDRLLHSEVVSHKQVDFVHLECEYTVKANDDTDTYTRYLSQYITFFNGQIISIEAYSSTPLSGKNAEVLKQIVQSTEFIGAARDRANGAGQTAPEPEPAPGMQSAPPTESAFTSVMQSVFAKWKDLFSIWAVVIPLAILAAVGLALLIVWLCKRRHEERTGGAQQGGLALESTDTLRYYMEHAAQLSRDYPQVYTPTYLNEVSAELVRRKKNPADARGTFSMPETGAPGHAPGQSGKAVDVGAQPTEPQLKGIGGWLILVAIGVVGGAVVALISTLALLGGGNLIIGILMLCLAGYHIYLCIVFFECKRIFRILYIIGASLNCIAVLFTAANFGQALMSVASTALWIAYMCNSCRVQNTFVN